MTGLDGGLAAAARGWRAADPDPQTRAELDQLLGSADAAALAERFEGSLAFGTAGIRAAMGAGPMRMNRLVVGRVAAGLARYIADRDPAGVGAGVAAPGVAAGVVIGYDGRAKSDVFATDAARILSRAGVRVWLLPRALPTPVLAFSVRHLGTAYGLMVTASHNPRQDNGVKLYVSDGGQLLPPDDADIAAAIDAVDPLRLPAGWDQGPFEFRPADEAVRAYVTAVAAGGRPPVGAPKLTVVHTALHGVGDAVLRAALDAVGWPPPVPVAAQQAPDPDFPTVPYPNPEAAGVLDLARATAEEHGADLVIANDPDADRLAVMVPGPAGWRALTGDELGALLGDATLRRLAGGDAAGQAGRVPIAAPGSHVADHAVGEATGVPLGDRADEPVAGRSGGNGGSGGQPVVATTVVSGSLLRRLAEAADVRCVTTLTGFKWIARADGNGGGSADGGAPNGGGREDHGLADSGSAANRGSPADGDARAGGNAHAAGGGLVYGYEQALGYAVRPDLVRDKDGISAALLVLQLAAELARQGRTLADRLDDLALAHGVHVTGQRSLRAAGAAGLARLAEAVDRVRKDPPRTLAGQPVTVTDLLDVGGAIDGGMADDGAGAVDLAGGRGERSPGRPLPPANVLIWRVGTDARVMIRPSGTEPDLKLYAEAVWPAQSRDELDAARASATGQVERLLAAAAAALEPGPRTDQG